MLYFYEKFICGLLIRPFRNRIIYFLKTLKKKFFFIKKKYIVNRILPDWQSQQLIKKWRIIGDSLKNTLMHRYDLGWSELMFPRRWSSDTQYFRYGTPPASCGVLMTVSRYPLRHNGITSFIVTMDAWVPALQEAKYYWRFCSSIS